MQPNVGLNLITLKGKPGDGGLEGRLRLASEAGFEGVGLWRADLEWWEREKGSLEDLRLLLHELGLAAAEVCFTPICNERGEVASVGEVFRRASEVGAGCVICIYNNPQAPIKKAREQWGEFLDRVADFGVRAAFEFIGSHPAYQTIDAAMDIVASGSDVGGLLVDTYHFWRGHSNIATLGSLTAEQLVLVHLNDVKNVPREQSTDRDRTYPGQGIMPLTHILSTIRSIGYDGFYDVEIFGECQEQDPKEVAAEALSSARKALQRAALRRR
jgi:sugar phosphate isomerase/epimerase